MSFSTTSVGSEIPKDQLEVSHWRIRPLLDLILRMTPFLWQPAPLTTWPCCDGIEKLIHLARGEGALAGQSLRMGSATAMTANLVLIKGDPSKRIGGIENVETLFKSGLS
jgi:hypothetical protein